MTETTSPDYHLVRAPDGDDDCFSIGFYCANADALVARAERSGPRSGSR